MSIVGPSPKGALAAQCENSKTFMPYFRLLPHSLVESAKLLRVSTAGARPAPPPLRLLHGSGSSMAPPHSSASGPHLAPPPAHAWGSTAKGAGQGRDRGGVRAGVGIGARAGAGQGRAHSAAVLSVLRALGHPVTLLLPSTFPILLTLGSSHGCFPPFVSWGNTGIPCHLLLF